MFEPHLRPTRESLEKSSKKFSCSNDPRFRRVLPPSSSIPQENLVLDLDCVSDVTAVGARKLSPSLYKGPIATIPKPNVNYKGVNKRSCDSKKVEDKYTNTDIVFWRGNMNKLQEKSKTEFIGDKHILQDACSRTPRSNNSQVKHRRMSTAHLIDDKELIEHFEKRNLRRSSSKSLNNLMRSKSLVNLDEFSTGDSVLIQDNNSTACDGPCCQFLYNSKPDFCGNRHKDAYSYSNIQQNYVVPAGYKVIHVCSCIVGMFLGILLTSLTLYFLYPYKHKIIKVFEELIASLLDASETSSFFKSLKSLLEDEEEKELTISETISNQIWSGLSYFSECTKEIFNRLGGLFTMTKQNKI